MLAGNVAALGVSCIVTIVLSFVFPQDFDWDIMRNGIRMVEQDGTDKLADSGEDSEEGLDAALRYVPGAQGAEAPYNHRYFLLCSSLNTQSQRHDKFHRRVQLYEDVGQRTHYFARRPLARPRAARQGFHQGLLQFLDRCLSGLVRPS